MSDEGPSRDIPALRGRALNTVQLHRPEFVPYQYRAHRPAWALEALERSMRRYPQDPAMRTRDSE